MLYCLAYIAVDGTSLTVCDVGPDWFNFMLVQYTQSKIVVAKKKVGDKVNLEVLPDADCVQC